MHDAAELAELLKSPPAGDEAYILDLITNGVPPGVDEAAYVKAAFLADLATGKASSPLIDAKHATELLGTMMGGYNIAPLVKLLDDPTLATVAARIGATKGQVLIDVGVSDQPAMRRALAKADRILIPVA